MRALNTVDIDQKYKSGEPLTPSEQRAFDQIKDAHFSDAEALLLLDCYKLGHVRMYPDNTEVVYSNQTARGSRIDGITKVVLFGRQKFTREVLEAAWDKFFLGDIELICAEYVRRVEGMLGPDSADTAHIRQLHALGYLPLRICSFAEGTEVPLRIPMFTIENTVDGFGWLTNYVETIMSTETWQAITSATKALHFRRMLDAHAEATSDEPGFADWQGHDFSMRGMSSNASGNASGMGHLLSFAGTDTVPALGAIEKNYDPSPEAFLGGSVPATEHSVMCAGGEGDEIETFSRLLDLYPTGILSVVSDTWDYWQVLTEYLPALKDKIMARDGKLVIRPDSGTPELILCGDPDAPEGSPAHKGTFELLWEAFGGTVNSKGYRVLDDHIGMIYGDSITYESADSILDNFRRNKIATTAAVFGLGSFHYQFNTRDTFAMAIKATWAKVDGVGRSLSKDPKTDPNSLKKSAKGRLAVLRDPQTAEMYLVNEATSEQEFASLLQPVWEDGVELVTERWDDIVARVGVRVLA